MPDPIRDRLDTLHDQWVSFADDPRARLLVWNARDDERPLVDAFIARECDPDQAETPDLFLQLITPWTSSEGHGARLAQELRSQVAESELSLELRSDDVVDALASLQRQLGDRTLAVWLEPSAIHEGSYLLWLQRLVHAAPEGIRFLAVGDFYSPLAKAEPQRVREVACALDMPAALEALADRAGGASPDDVFRRLQTQLNARLVAGDLRGALETSQRAIALALEQGWPQLAATVQLIMGAAFVGRAQHVDAIGAYREAERHASVAGLEKVRLIALLGGASVLFTARAYGPASETYLRAAALAAELADARSELDGYRMAALSYAELGEREHTWTAGVRGLCAATAMSPEQRATSTLHELGAQLRHMFRGDARVTALDAQLASLSCG